MVEIEEDELAAILEIVSRGRGLDLHDYWRSTLKRRIASRLEALGLSDAARYRARLDSDRAEVDRLAESLLIHVTEFFRDPEVFAALEERVLPRLLERARSLFRAWVVGAATGEEAYSLAMLLAVTSERAQVLHEVLATDRHAPSLEGAREGRYPKDTVVASVPPDLVSRFFRADGGALTVVESLRDRIVFSQHDFMGARLAPKNAILAEFDVVLCRNVLIYLDERFREGAFERLAAVVRAGGALVLGHSESLPRELGDRFEAFPGVEAGLRIYRRLPA